MAPSFDSSGAMRKPYATVWGSVTGFLLVSAFVVDINTPLGVADWWAYTVAIVTALFWRGRLAAVIVTVIAIVLTIVGGALSPSGDQIQGWTNRGLGVVLCILLGAGCVRLGTKEIEVERSRQQLQRMLDDREAIGRDLHDGILQNLYAVGLGLEVAKVELARAPREALARLDRAISDLNGVMRGVRAMTAGDESDVLQGEELDVGLRALVKRLTDDKFDDCLVEIDAEAAKALTRAQARHLAFIAVEAMSNSVRHANARHGSLMLALRNDHVMFEWRDDGTGFKTATSRTGGGHGLGNIKKRADQLRASLKIASSSAEGTAIVLEIPYERDAA